MTEKQRQFSRTKLFYRCDNGVIEYGYRLGGVWYTMGTGTYANVEELGQKLLAVTDEQLFSMYLKHRKSQRVAESLS